jgi:DNA-binding winged helix-turn-helix (wHTH) protein
VSDKDSGTSQYRVADLSIDFGMRRIRRRGRTLHCGRLTFDLLALLVRSAPRVVSREEIAERLWAGRFVGAATVKRRIALLRAALNDTAKDPKYLRTIHGQGYSLIPPVRRVTRFSDRLPDWARPGLAACALILVFVTGAEIGYQDGLRPVILHHQGSTRIVVTSWPYELSGTEYAFVTGAATALTNVIHRTEFIERMMTADAADTSPGAESLTIMASATNNDVETIYLTLALLGDDRPDHRPSRQSELSLWSRELQDVREPVVTAFGSTGAPDYRTHFPISDSASEHFLLVANLRFDRQDITERPEALQYDAALAIAMAIDARLPPAPILGL